MKHGFKIKVSKYIGSHQTLTVSPSSPRSPVAPTEPRYPRGPFGPERPSAPESPDGPFQYKGQTFIVRLVFSLA